jgi:hypothetical protein
MGIGTGEAISGIGIPSRELATASGIEQGQGINSRDNNVQRTGGVGGGVEEGSIAPGTREAASSLQSLVPGSQFLPLPQSTRQHRGGNQEEEEDERETTSSSDPLLSNSFLTHFITNYTQPREEPSQTLAERHRVTPLEDGWNSYMGRTITLKEAEEGDNRKRRTEDSDPNTDTRVWHRLSIRPEMLLPSTIPRTGRNAYMKRLIQGSSRTFNPLTFVLFPEALAAIQRRDRWIIPTWPLFQEAIIPAAFPNALDAERLEMERTFMENANREQAAFDVYAAGYSEAEAAHLLDSMVVSVDKAADLETRRRAAETTTMFC